MHDKITYKNPGTYWTVTPLTIILEIKEQNTDKSIAVVEWDKETFFRRIREIEEYEKKRGVINGQSRPINTDGSYGE